MYLSTRLPPHASTNCTVHRTAWVCYVRIWCEFAELEQISRVTSGLSEYEEYRSNARLSVQLGVPGRE